ncbi:MAG: DegT/DnrJ/EryC1/StrS family aminotransferase, partial [Planctomycetes bacterium]|nr:DegT/DnrJ/EryC1/StrS family aminotransferase [Planctomycetota bacterium]
VFVDIDPTTYNIDPGLIEAAITPRTKAILPVHLFGQPCDMEAIGRIAERHGLLIIEDCAQAMGAKFRGRHVGTFGHVGCFSFFPSKNLGAMGDGGMVVTGDQRLYERIEILRRHGGRVKYHHEEVGLNSRLDELQAAILRVKLPRLDRWNELRRQHACRYNVLLADVPGLTRPREVAIAGTIIPTGPSAPQSDLVYAVYHQYTLLADGRDHVLESLQAEGIGCYVYYPVPLHRQQVYAALNYGRGSLPQAEAAAARCFSIPMFPELTSPEQSAVAEAVKRAVAQQTATRAA